MDNIQRPVLYQYFKDSANVLLSEYERSRGQRASANLGYNRELFCNTFLKHVLPPKLTLRSGEIWDSQGNRTGQLDVVLLRDDTPSLTFGGTVSGADTYLVEGVFSVIEVKSNLTRDKLQESLTTLKQVKSLQPYHNGTIMNTGPVLYRALRCIFAYEGASWETLAQELCRPENQEVVDVISILNRGALIAKGLLMQFETEALFKSFNGKAASLAWLYFHLISYSTSFLGRSLSIVPYFEPITGWVEDENRDF